MADHSESGVQGDAGDSHRRDRPAARRLGTWLAVAAIGAGSIVGALLLERYSRPVEENAREAPAQISGLSGQSGSPQAGVAGSLSPAPTADELTAEARQLADRLVETLPDGPQALTLGGRIYYAFGDVAKADAAWDRCLKLVPDFPEARCAVGVAAWDRGDFRKAATDFQVGTAKNPRLLGEHLFQWADSLMNLGKESEAAALLENAARTSRLSPAGSYVLGQSYLQSGEYEKARQQFEAALAGDPQFANAHYALAMALMRLGQADEARKHRELYTKLKLNDMAIRDRAQGMGRSADKTNPADVARLAAYFSLSAGKIYALGGRIDEAERLWLRALTLDPRDPEPRKILEILYRGQGRADSRCPRS